MTFAERLAQDRRRFVLEALALDADFALNDGVLKLALADIGQGTTARSQVRADLEWLESAGLIRIERLPTQDAAEVWIARLLEDGQDVASGRSHPGVARRVPR